MKAAESPVANLTSRNHLGGFHVTQQSPAPGWYPDPSDAGKRMYWDGTAWNGPPPPADADNSNISKETAIAIGVCVLVAIGLVMSMQSASLLTGTGPIWTGVGVVAAGTAVAFFMRATKWVRVVAALVLAFALFNAIYMEKQLSDKSNEISQIFKH
jgi:hypothetical protein